jgi:hypothetical protein
MPKESIPRSKSGRIMDYIANRSNVGRPFRAIKNLMDDPPSLTGPIRREDIERSFDAAGAVTAGSMGARRPPNSVGTGARPFKVKGAESQVKVTQPKPGTSKFIGPAKPKAKKSEAKEAAAPSKPSSPRYKVSGAQQIYTGPKPKPGSRGFIGPTRATQPGEKGFIGPTRPPRSGDKDFIGPRQAPRSGDKDFIGPVNKPSSPKKESSMAKRAGIAGGATAAITGTYYATKKDSEPRKAFGGARPERTGSYPASSRSSAGARPERPGSYPAAKRKAAGTYTKSYDKKPASAASGGAPKPKQKPARVASDKSSQSGKMTSFQRMKARQFEKEGVAGRSMTRSAAQKKAMEKSGGPKISLASMKERLSSAFKPKVSGSKPKPLVSAFAKKNLAANQAIGKKK